VAIACTSGEESPGADAKKGPASAAAKATPQVLAQGAKIYETTCAPCHGAHGKGDGPAGAIFKPPPRDHTDRAYMETMTDDDLRKVITMGGAIRGKPLMPSNPQITGQNLEALLAFVRSLSREAGTQ
jgi:high-affinity iron transporter